MNADEAICIPCQQVIVVQKKWVCPAVNGVQCMGTNSMECANSQMGWKGWKGWQRSGVVGCIAIHQMVFRLQRNDGPKSKNGFDRAIRFTGHT